MESKVPNVEFDKDKIDAESRTNLSSDLFDSKQREIDLAIKKQKLIFLSIKNISLCCGVVLSWITVIWSVLGTAPKIGLVAHFNLSLVARFIYGPT